jgi:plasmid stabilization system protein ParE
MGKIIWADPAIHDLDAIADYIAVENAAAARELIHRIFAAVERLQKFPRMGSLPGELRGLPYRQLIVPLCRIFYRAGKNVIYIVHVLRAEQLVRGELFPTPRRTSKPPVK